MNKTEEVVAGLNDLIEKHYDAEAGYIEAAKQTDDLRLKKYFKFKSDKRNEFGHELKDEIARLGGEPKKGGSVAGSLHRLWMDLITAISSNDDETILGAAAFGDQATLEEYDKVIAIKDLPQRTLGLIQVQRAKVATTLEQVQLMETVKD